MLAVLKSHKQYEQFINIKYLLNFNKRYEIYNFSLIHPHPNTYTFSKRLAEDVVCDFFPQLPVVIARPSIGTVTLVFYD